MILDGDLHAYLQVLHVDVRLEHGLDSMGVIATTERLTEYQLWFFGSGQL